MKFHKSTERLGGGWKFGFIIFIGVGGGLDIEMVFQDRLCAQGWHSSVLCAFFGYLVAVISGPLAASLTLVFTPASLFPSHPGGVMVEF